MSLFRGSFFCVVSLSTICSMVAIAQVGGITGMPTWNPQGISLHLELQEPGPFREMETIPARLRLQNDNPEERTPPHTNWGLQGFVVEPGSEHPQFRPCGDLANPCHEGIGTRYVEASWINRDVHGARTLNLLLTEYVPPLPPGNYEITALFGQSSTERVPGFDTATFPPRPRMLARSNTISFQVIPADEGWVRQRAEDAEQAFLQTKRIMAGNRATDGPTVDSLNRTMASAAHQLELLDSPVAWRIALRTLAQYDEGPFRAITRTRYPAEACRFLHAYSSEPGHIASPGYMGALAWVCAHAEVPALAAAATPEAPEDVARMQESVRTAEAAGTEARREAQSRELATISARDAAQQARAFDGLLSSFGTIEAATNADDVSLALQVTHEFLRALPYLEPLDRIRLLQRLVQVRPASWWTSVLEANLGTGLPGDGQADRSYREVLRAIHYLDPQRAQALILAELRKKQTWLDLDTLLLLPAVSLQGRDAELTQILEDSPRGSTGRQAAEMAIALYASSAVLPQVVAHYQSNVPHCQVGLLGYFARAEPTMLSTALSDIWDRRNAPRECLSWVIRTLPYLQMTPEVEAFLVMVMRSGEPRYQSSAAGSLGRYGTAQALPVLSDELVKVHSEWQKDNGASASAKAAGDLAESLVYAIARGQAWIAEPEMLRKLEPFCVTWRCQWRLQGFIESWHQPVQIKIVRSVRGISFEVAQYNFHLNASMDLLAAKLRQFPSETKFRMKIVGTSDPEFTRWLRLHLPAQWTLE